MNRWVHGSDVSGEQALPDCSNIKKKKNKKLEKPHLIRRQQHEER